MFTLHTRHALAALIAQQFCDPTTWFSEPLPPTGVVPPKARRADFRCIGAFFASVHSIRRMFLVSLIIFAFQLFLLSVNLFHPDLFFYLCFQPPTHATFIPSCLVPVLGSCVISNIYFLWVTPSIYYLWVTPSITWKPNLKPN